MIGDKRRKNEEKRKNIKKRLDKIKNDYLSEAKGYYLWKICNTKNYSEEDIKLLSDRYGIEPKYSFGVMKWSEEFDFLSDDYEILIDIVAEVLKKDRVKLLSELEERCKLQAEKEVKLWLDEYDMEKKTEEDTEQVT
jgi:hypothetical protein